MNATTEALFRYGCHVPLQGLLLLTAVLYIVGVRVRSWWAWTIAVAGLAAYAADLWMHYPPLGTDIRYFWLNGQDIVAGLDPYRGICLNPPTALPLFALFGQFGFERLLLVWTIVNAALFPLLVIAAYAGLRQCADGSGGALPLPMLGVLSALLSLSVATRLHLSVGQLSLLVTFALVVSLAAQQRGRGWAAGLGLAVATIKPATMLPFLLLFHRRTERRTWAWLAAFGLVFVFALTTPAELPTRLSECLGMIERQGQPGGMNNFATHVNVDLIGLDRALHYLGLAERQDVRVLQVILLLALGGLVSWQVLREGIPAAAAWSLVSFYAMLFLYHRLYDTPVLVIPLLYACCQARVQEGVCRWLHAGCAMAVLSVFYFRYETVQAFCYAATPATPVGRIMAAIVILHAIWLILAGLLLLVAAEHAGRKATGAEPEALLQAA